jgi:hypothetical protein
MVERICPACKYGNTVDSQYCNKCGAALERLVRAQPEPSTALATRGKALPVKWQQIGKTVAIGAVALAAEAGISWLKRRIEQSPAPAPLARASQTQPPAKTNPAQRVTTIISRRVIEVQEHNDGTHSIQDKHVWRKIEE